MLYREPGLPDLIKARNGVTTNVLRDDIALLHQLKVRQHRFRMSALRTANLIIAFIATTAPIAHTLEMISKLTLDGPLWLGIQQHLYRGWGEIFGPVEIIALLSTLILLVLTWRDRSSRRAYLIAMLCYAALLADFFIFNWPVNEALRGWTPVTLPSNWSDYRLRWEIGHALAALLSVIAFVTLIRRPIYEGSQS